MPARLYCMKDWDFGCELFETLDGLTAVVRLAGFSCLLDFSF